MKRPTSRIPARPWILILLTLAATGCGAATPAESPAVNGRRVQAPAWPTPASPLEGWARQRDIGGELLTVFDLSLNYRGPRSSRVAATDSGDPTPFAVRVVVNEGSGIVTLTSRH